MSFNDALNSAQGKREKKNDPYGKNQRATGIPTKAAASSTKADESSTKATPTTATKSAVRSKTFTSDDLGEWLSEKVPPRAPVAAGLGENGRKRIQEAEYEFDIYDPSRSFRETRDRDARTWLNFSNLVNDVNGRIANLRKDMVDEEPVYEWTTPEGNTFTEDELETVLKVAGRHYTKEEYERPKQYVNYRIVPKGDPTAIGTDPNGNSWTADAFVMNDDSVIPRDKYLDRTIAYQWYPKDGTIVRYGDGTVPEESEGKIRKRQTNASTAGYEEPRLPWMDSAGNIPLLDENWDYKDLPSPGEGLAATADLFLGSAPYMIPRYKWISAAAQSIPNLYGYHTDTYEPSGEGLRDLGKLGRGTYEDKEISRGQMIGAALSPWVDAWAENAFSKGQKSFGGLPKFVDKIPGASAFARKHPGIAEVLGGAATEGFEEAWSVLPSALSRDGVQDLFAEPYFDESVEDIRYRDTPTKDRFNNLLKEGANNIGAGAWMGGTLSGLREVLFGAPQRYIQKKYGGGPMVGSDMLPKAVTMSQDEIAAAEAAYLERLKTEGK